MEIEYSNHKQITPTIAGEDIEIGTIFEGRIGESSEKGVFLKIYEGIVDLRNPNRTWIDGLPSIKEYSKLDARLIVRGYK